MAKRQKTSCSLRRRSSRRDSRWHRKRKPSPMASNSSSAVLRGEFVGVLVTGDGERMGKKLIFCGCFNVFDGGVLFLLAVLQKLG